MRQTKLLIILYELSVIIYFFVFFICKLIVCCSFALQRPSTSHMLWFTTARTLLYNSQCTQFCLKVLKALISSSSATSDVQEVLSIHLLMCNVPTIFCICTHVCYRKLFTTLNLNSIYEYGIFLSVQIPLLHKKF